MDLADMLLGLYRITVKTQCWNIKLLRHFIDIAKVNDWIIYRCYYAQKSLPPKDMLSLLNFSTEISDSLIHAKKLSAIRGRSNKSASQESLLAVPK